MPGARDSAEHRRSVRRYLAADVSVLDCGRRSLAPIWGSCGDISRGGLFVKTDEQLSDQLTVRIMVPDDWLLATCENASLQNPDKAIALAKRACESTEYKDAYILDTLATAYASAGKFDEAVTTAQQAINIAENSKDEGQKKLISDIRKRLELFKNSRPYIENPNPK